MAEIAIQIAAGEPLRLSLWPQHIEQLLRITLLRREIYGHEPYPFIVWWLASIDTHVVLSGAGNGKFVETMLRHNILSSDMDPQNLYHIYDYNSPSCGLASPKRCKALPSALAFHRRINILAAELGLLARDIRAEEKQNPNDRSDATVKIWQERIDVLQDTIRRAWNVQIPVSVASGYCNEDVPIEDRGIFEHVSVNFFTSFWNFAILPNILRTRAPRSFWPFQGRQNIGEASTSHNGAWKPLEEQLLTNSADFRPLPCLLDLLSYFHVQVTTSLIAIKIYPRGHSM